MATIDYLTHKYSSTLINWKFSSIYLLIGVPGSGKTYDDEHCRKTSINKILPSPYQLTNSHSQRILDYIFFNFCKWMQQLTTSLINTHQLKMSLINNSLWVCNLATSSNLVNKCLCLEYKTNLDSANKYVSTEKSTKVGQCACWLVFLDQGRHVWWWTLSVNIHK